MSAEMADLVRPELGNLLFLSGWDVSRISSTYLPVHEPACICSRLDSVWYLIYIYSIASPMPSSPVPSVISWLKILSRHSFSSMMILNGKPRDLQKLCTTWYYLSLSLAGEGRLRKAGRECMTVCRDHIRKQEFKISKIPDSG